MSDTGPALRHILISQVMSGRHNKIIIVGAGVAGLTLAYKLSCNGEDVLLVEKESQVGGLARSFEYDGFVFDIGPHRFHTDIPGVIDFIKEILGDEYITIERKSSVWMFGRYFDWPLRPSALLKMPLPVLFSVGMDMLRRKKKGGDSFEGYIVSRYGKTLYEIFFRPYTEKFLKLPCSAISEDWAVTGIERAVIDNRVRVTDAYELARSVVFPAPSLEFIYPKNGGIGLFSKKLRERIVSNGGTILSGSEVKEIIRGDGIIKEVVVGDQVYDCNLLVWAGAMTDILKLLGCMGSDLEYLSLLLFNYEVGHEPLFDYQWCYFGTEDIPFNRISVPSLFNPLLAPPGRTGLCVEVTCRKGTSEWQQPDMLEPMIRGSLKKVGAIRDKRDITGLHIERVPNAYPVYGLDYREKKMEATKIIEGCKNIKLLGRSGSFWYNNMDHSINAALNLYNELKRCPESF